jgi:hypothetical protein
MNRNIDREIYYNRIRFWPLWATSILLFIVGNIFSSRTVTGIAFGILFGLAITAFINFWELTEEITNLSEHMLRSLTALKQLEKKKPLQSHK